MNTVKGRTLENNRWALSGNRSPMNLRRSNYLTNSELEYVVKKDMGCRVEPFGLVPAVSLKQRQHGAKYNDTGNSRLEFLARQLDLVTAELNESIGRVSHKKLRQTIDKLNVLRSQMNQIRYDESKPRKQAIEETYSPRAIFGDGKPSLPSSARHKHDVYSSASYADGINTMTSDDENVRKEMEKLVKQSSNRRPAATPLTSSLRRAGSTGDLLAKPNLVSDDFLDGRDPLVNAHFPGTAKFQAETFSTDPAWRPTRPSTTARVSSVTDTWQPAPQRPTYDPSKYMALGDLTTDDVVTLAQETNYDPDTFQLQLLKLKADKLRLEEEALLEMRRLAELERIRGPRPKWYALKTPNFWYEASKNNDQVRQPWDDSSNSNYLRQYRQSLLRASTAFEHKWSSRKY